MLEWMQRHKKYLVITVWVSAFALIFAGLVEWGRGGFSASNANSVAKVGNKTITFQEYDSAYYALYNKLKQFFGDDNGEKIPEIEQEVFSELVRAKLLESLADDLGIVASNNDIVNYLITRPEFLDNTGQFNKQQYLNILAANHYSAEKFEDIVSKAILDEKMQNFPLFQTSMLENNAFTSAMLVQDELSIGVVDKSALLHNVAIKISESEIKNFWEKHKAKYFNPANYKIAYIALDFNQINVSDEELQHFYNENKTQYSSNAMIDEKERLLEDYKKEYTKLAFNYLQKQDTNMFKKAEFQDSIVNIDEKGLYALRHSVESKASKNEDNSIQIHFANLSEDKLFLSPKLLEQLNKNNGLLAPIEYESKHWIIPYVVDKKPQIELSFEQAKDRVMQDLKQEKEEQQFKNSLQDSVNTMQQQLTKVGYISVLDLDANISSKHSNALQTLRNMGLQDAEIGTMLNQIMTKNTSKGFVLLNANKAVIYRIDNQKLPDYEEMLNLPNNIANSIEEQKTRDMRNAVIEYAMKHYKILDYRRKN